MTMMAIDLYTSHTGGFMTSYDVGKNNSLYHNNGDGTFTQITNLPIVNDSAYTRGHAWADLNNDGWLDLFLGNDGGGNIHQNDFLYISDGQGSFNQITTGDIVNDNGRTQGFALGDYDNDGFIDIFTSLDKLYHNNGDGTFTTITNTIASQFWVNWSNSWVDYDNDQNLDLFIHGSSGYPSRLLKNNGDGTFTALENDPLVTTVINNNGGQTWGDYDNDGDLDVFVSDFYKNQLYSNNGNGTFTRIMNEVVGNENVAESYGATWCDFDKDGDLDLFVPNAFGNPPNYFYINTYQNNGNANHWIDIKCNGTQSNRSAIGARIYVKAIINGQSKWQMREINANHAAPQGGVNPLNQHFGLGNAAIIDTLKVYWPASHITQIFTNVTPDRYIEITEGDNTIYAGKECKPDLPPSNVGYVTGQVYQDENNNCIYDAGIDFPIANRMVQADPGPYFVTTNDDGFYTFRIEAGNYSIHLAKQDYNNRSLQICQQDSLYYISILKDSTSSGNNFSLKLTTDTLGNCIVTVNTTFFGIDNCLNGPTYITPCPGHFHNYLYTVSNSINSTSPIPANTTLLLNLSSGMIFSGPSLLSCAGPLSPFGGSTITRTFTNQIVPGGTCNTIIRVWVPIGAPSPYISTAQYTVPSNPPGTNIIVNGDFELVGGFFSDYAIGCQMDGLYQISPGSVNAPLPPCNNWNHRGLDNTPGAGVNFLYADGANVTNWDVWREVRPVTIGQQYTFTAWYNNVSFQNNGSVNPRMQFLVNNTPTGNVVDLPMLPDIWVPFSASFTPSTSPVTLQLRSITGTLGSNDFGIDDISCISTNCGGIVFDQLIQNDACSCDPNDKLVNPSGCGINGNIKKDKDLKYTIHFQNIGSGPAHNILVKDYLDRDLDFSTIQILGSSHTITYSEILPDSSLIIFFEGIELPDSLSNPEGSNGYFTFSIKPKYNLLDGTVINNKAGVYFDNNEVVITNSTKNTLYEYPSPIASFSSNHACNSVSSYNFTYTGITTDNTSYLWDFGVNAIPQTSTNQNPMGIIFTNPSSPNYVTLTVFRNGCESSVTDSISIEDISCGMNKVLVCHNGHTICISNNALPAHLAHGDCIGSCQNINKSKQFNNKYFEKEINFNIQPNPAKNETNINFSIPDNDDVVLTVYNFMGQKVAELFNNYAISGEDYSVVFSLSNLSSGVYVVILKTSNVYEKRKLFIVK